MCGLCFEFLLLVLSICFASLVSLVEIFLLLWNVFETVVTAIAWACFGYTMLALVIFIEILIDVLDYGFLALENSGNFLSLTCSTSKAPRWEVLSPNRTRRTPGGPLLSV